jgi:hypothetical protein
MSLKKSKMGRCEISLISITQVSTQCNQFCIGIGLTKCSTKYERNIIEDPENGKK